MDPRTGRWAASNLAEYLVPVNADAPDVAIEFVEVHDELVGPLGAKGVGEIGQVGVAAAIANAVFHATGRRVRELPIAPELVMDRRVTAAMHRASRARLGLGLRGLWLVLPIAALLAAGAGGPETSLRVLAPARLLLAGADRDGRVLVGRLAGHAAASELVGLGRHRADRRRSDRSHRRWDTPWPPLSSTGRCARPRSRWRARSSWSCSS